ncbi:MAG: hypothetical protein Q7S40_14480 [Opitutaceae bacterium]|nr:hypothetical protein [Opitutaceae bacterium]
MSRPRHPASLHVGRNRRRGSLAVEAGLALLIIVLAAWLGAELLGRIQQRRRCDRFVADLRTIAAAFQRHGREMKGAPLTRGDEGRLPPRLEGLLQGTNWRHGSPFGGDYEWLPRLDGAMWPGVANQREAGPGAIAVTAFSPAYPLTATRADWLRIDAAIDDGNLATGRFRTRFNGWPVYLLTEKP